MKRKERSPLSLDDRGFVLVLGMIIVSVLMMLGTTAVLTSTTDLRISANQRNASQVFHIAEAGSEAAREELRRRLATGASLSSLLAASRGPDGNLTNSADFNNYFLRQAFVSDDVPLVPGTNFGTGAYRVFLSNDPVEGETNPTDANDTVTITSIATGPGNAWAVVQVTVRRLVPPNLPGAIVLPGPNVTFHGGNSNAQIINGMNMAAVAVNSAASLTSVIQGIPRPDLYVGNCKTSPCVQNISIPYPWNSLEGLKDVVAALSSIAHYTSTSAPGFDWGSAATPRIVVIDGDVSIGGGISGHGIIVATGRVRLHGNFSFRGMILAIGRGEIERNGGGNGLIEGSVLAANIAGPDRDMNTADDTWGSPLYDTSGGGNSDIEFNSAAMNNNINNIPLVRTSWRRSGF